MRSLRGIRARGDPYRRRRYPITISTAAHPTASDQISADFEWAGRTGRGPVPPGANPLASANGIGVCPAGSGSSAVPGSAALALPEPSRAGLDEEARSEVRLSEGASSAWAAGQCGGAGCGARSAVHSEPVHHRCPRESAGSVYQPASGSVMIRIPPSQRLSRADSEHTNRARAYAAPNTGSTRR